MPTRRESANQSQRRGPEQPASAGLPPEMQRMLAARMRSLRLGATCCAALGGVAFYVLLTHLGVQGVVAGIVGLIFALLGRMALASLAAEWLVAVTRRDAAARSARSRDDETPKSKRVRGS